MQEKDHGLADRKRVARFRLYLFSSFLGNLVAPIFSFFLPILAVEIGASRFEVGLVGGGENIVYAFMPFVMGQFTDRGRSRRFFIILGFAVLTAISAFYSIASNPIALIIARLFEGLGWSMLWPAIESSITVETLGNSGRALSFFNTSWSLGAAVGPLVGGVLIVFGSTSFVYFSTALMLAFALGTNLVSFLRSNEAGSSVPRRQTQSVLNSIRKLFQRGDEKKNFQVRLYAASVGLSFSGVAVIYTFFGPYAESLDIPILLIAALPVTFGVVRFLIYVLSTRENVQKKLLNPKKRNTILFISLLISCSSPLIILVRDSSGAIYFLAFGLFAVGLAVCYFVSQVGMIAETNETEMGAGAGIFESVIGVGGSIGPVVAGLVSASNLSLAFIVPFAGFVVVMGILLADAKRRGAL